MNIKVERIHNLDGDGPLKAFCDVVLEDSFMVKGLRIIKGKEGPFVGMPGEKSKTGKWFETFYPINEEARRGLSKVVLGCYENKG